jgi:hypothetical protein
VDQYLPATVRRRPRGGDVTTQVDEHTATGGVVGAVGATVRGDRLGRRSEVEQNAGRHGHDAVLEGDHRPPRRNAHRRAHSVSVSERGDVAVISKGDHCRADRRIDIAVGLAGCRERGVEQIRQ